MLRAETFPYLGVRHTREAGKPLFRLIWCGRLELQTNHSFPVQAGVAHLGMTCHFLGVVILQTQGVSGAWCDSKRCRHCRKEWRLPEISRWQSCRAPQCILGQKERRHHFDVCFLHVKIWLGWAQPSTVFLFFASNSRSTANCLLPPVDHQRRKNSCISRNPPHFIRSTLCQNCAFPTWCHKLEVGQHDAIFRHANKQVPSCFHQNAPIHINPFPPKKKQTTESQHSLTSKSPIKHNKTLSNEVDTKWLKHFCNLSMVSMAFSCSFCFTAGSGKARHVANVAAGCGQGGSASGSGAPCSSRWRCGLKSSLTSHMAPRRCQCCHGKFCEIQMEKSEAAGVGDIYTSNLWPFWGDDSPVDLELPFLELLKWKRWRCFSGHTEVLPQETNMYYDSIWFDDIWCMQWWEKACAWREWWVWPSGAWLHEMQPGHEMLKANRKAVQRLQNPAVIQYDHLAVCQNLVPLVNIKIAGKWMFIPLKMVLIGIDPYPFGLVSKYIVWFLYVSCQFQDLPKNIKNQWKPQQTVILSCRVALSRSCFEITRPRHPILKISAKQGISKMIFPYLPYDPMEIAIFALFWVPNLLFHGM